MFTVRKLLILIGRHSLIALSAIAIASVSIFFLAGAIERISDRVVLNHNLTASLEKRMELLATLKKDAETVGTNDVIIEKGFVSSDNILEFVATLDNLASKNTLIQAFHFETPAPSALRAPFPISTISYLNTLTANVSSFSRYLKDFEQIPYFTKIESMQIASQSSAGWSSTSAISFRATLFSKATQ